MIFEHPQDQNSHFACFKTNASHSLGMKIKKSLLASAIAVCVLASSSGAIQASNETYSYPITSADPVTTTTFPRTTAAKTFAWSSQTVIVGTKLKLSKIVSVKVKGKSNYRVSGVCSLRKGVLSFNRTGKCRISVSVKLKSTGKVLRSSKVIMVQAKTSVAIPAASSMPTLIGCVSAASDPATGTKYPASAAGWFEFQTGWICDYATLDARPLLEFFKSQGWVHKSTTSGMTSADMYKGSKRTEYAAVFSNSLPEGQTLLLLTFYL
jgi:hypothetical protein